MIGKFVVHYLPKCITLEYTLQNTLTGHLRWLIRLGMVDQHLGDRQGQTDPGLVRALFEPSPLHSLEVSCLLALGRRWRRNELKKGRHAMILLINAGFYTLFFYFCACIWSYTNSLATRGHVMSYRVKNMLDALQADGAPSFGKQLHEFCFERLQQFCKISLFVSILWSGHNRRPQSPWGHPRTLAPWNSRVPQSVISPMSLPTRFGTMFVVLFFANM